MKGKRSVICSPNISKKSSKSELLLVLFAFVHFLLYLCRVKWGIGAKIDFAPKAERKTRCNRKYYEKVSDNFIINPLRKCVRRKSKT